MATKKSNKEAAPAAAPAPAPVAQQAPVKKSNTTLIVILVLVFFFVVAPMIAAFGFGWWAKNKIKEGVNINNGAIGVNTESDQSWPTSLPTVVPKFADGKITSSGRLGDAWTISFSEVKKEEALKYQAALASAGFKVEEPADLGSMYSISATKDDVNVNLVWNGGDENSMLLSVTKGINIEADRTE